MMIQRLASGELPLIFGSVDTEHFPLTSAALQRSFDLRHVNLLAADRNILANCANSVEVLFTLLAVVADVENFRLFSKRFFYDLAAPDILQAQRIYLPSRQSPEEKATQVHATLEAWRAVYLKPVSGRESHDGRRVFSLSLNPDQTINLEGLLDQEGLIREENCTWEAVERKLWPLFATASPDTFAIERSIPYPRIGKRCWESRFVFHKPTADADLIYLESVSRLSDEGARSVTRAPIFLKTSEFLPIVLAAVRGGGVEPQQCEPAARELLASGIALGQRCSQRLADALADGVEYALGHRPPQSLCTPSELLIDQVYATPEGTSGPLQPHLMEIQLGGGLNKFAGFFPTEYARLQQSRVAQQASGIAEVLAWMKSCSSELATLARLTETCLHARQGDCHLAHALF